MRSPPSRSRGCRRRGRPRPRSSRRPSPAFLRPDRGAADRHGRACQREAPVSFQRPVADERRTLIKTASYEADPGEVGRVLLLYSGGLDTSVMLKWIQDEYEAEVVALTVNLGQPDED